MLTEEEPETTDGGPAHFEDRLRRIEAGMVELSRRVAALEAGSAPQGHDAAAMEVVAEAEEPRSDLSIFLSLSGRTFMVFGGAFLLRALTDSGRVPRGVGIVLGLSYALVWLLAAERTASPGRRLSSIFHGGAAIIIGFPLLWEATTRFALLTPAASAAAAAVFTAAVFAVAWHRDLPAVAALAAASAVAIGLALVVASEVPAPFVLLLVAVGAGTVWLGEACAWPWLPWLPALVADAAVASLTMRDLQAEQGGEVSGVMLAQLLLVAAYLASFVLRIGVHRRPVKPFEAIQTFAALAVGLVGAAVLTHSRGGGEPLIGLASAALAAAAYAAAIAARRERGEAAVNFHYYAAAALLLALTGCFTVLRGGELAVLVASLCVCAAWLAHRLAAVDPAFHAAVYAAVAAAASGWLGMIGAAFVAAPAGAWPAITPPMWFAIGAAGIAVVIPRPSSPEIAGAVAASPHAFIALLLVLEVSAMIIAASAPALAGTPPAAGVLATLRTSVLAGVAVLLAVARRRSQTAALGWLAYPVLAAIGIKLVVEDLRHSEPATLFVALALFGVALVVTARLVRRRADA